MQTLLKLKLRLAQTTGAVTEEYSFMAVVALLVVGVLAFVTKSPVFGRLFVSLFQNVFTHSGSWLDGLFG